MTNKIEHAFILTAGKGTRLRPYTDDKPKPMVEIDGKPILHYIVEKIKEFGIKNITMNLFYLGDRIEKYFKENTKTHIHFSHENTLLDTGGGVKKALNNMQGKPFFLINGDAFWQDTPAISALEQLARDWNPDIMDMLLLLQPVKEMTITQGVGDYNFQESNNIIRTLDQSGSHMFTGIRIVHPRVFDDTPDDAFSFLHCMDKAQESGKLYGVSYEGQWHHISTPKDLESVNELLQQEKHIRPQTA